MPGEPAILDTDTLSELSRGNVRVRRQALAYLQDFGRLTITAITVFERLRGYRAALRAGKPFEEQHQAFQALVAHSIVLPFDGDAAAVGAEIWSRLTRPRSGPSKRSDEGFTPEEWKTRAQRRQLGDVLIAAIAVSRELPLVTRNRRDFERLATASRMDLRLLDWARER